MSQKSRWVGTWSLSSLVNNHSLFSRLYIPNLFVFSIEWIFSVSYSFLTRLQWALHIFAIVNSILCAYFWNLVILHESIDNFTSLGIKIFKCILILLKVIMNDNVSLKFRHFSWLYSFPSKIFKWSYFWSLDGNNTVWWIEFHTAN